MLYALYHVFPTALDGLVKHLRIGEGIVGWTDGVQELAQVEYQLALLLFIQSLGLRSGFEQSRGGQQVALFEHIKDGILLPVGCAETFISFSWLDNRLDILVFGPELERGRCHQLGVLLDKIAIVSPGTARVTDGVDPDLLEGTSNLNGINWQQLAVRVGLPELVDQGEPGISLRLLFELPVCGLYLLGRMFLHSTLNQLAPC